MKLLILVTTFGLILAGISPGIAQAKKANKKTASVKKPVVKKSAIKSQSDLQTDVKFDDSVLHGQYQTPDEALAKIENEKGLSDLLGVRKHFKDRLATASEQE